MQKKIAIVGTGIAGMGCAHFLNRDHDLTVFEQNDYAGGHANTITILEEERSIPIDTGFIVFNHLSYPNLTKLFNTLGVVTKKCPMSFGVQHRPSGLEYSGQGLKGLFAQWQNLIKPRHIKMLLEIRWFRKQAKADLESGAAKGISMMDYCTRKKFSKDFLYKYLAPRSAALWNLSIDLALSMPAESVIRFLMNHGLLGLTPQYQWYSVYGGSRQYRNKLIASYKNKINLNKKVATVTPGDNKVKLVTADGEEFIFDQVILACHADQALSLLSSATQLQKELLGRFKYQQSRAVLHTDTTVMPGNKKAWGAWNSLILEKDGQLHTTTIYSMNLLQNVSRINEYFVSINDPGLIDPAKVLKEINYEHPAFTVEALEVQNRLGELNREGNIFFCGSYFGHGFHEDALLSAVKLCEQFLGKKLEEKMNWTEISEGYIYS